MNLFTWQNKSVNQDQLLFEIEELLDTCNDYEFTISLFEELNSQREYLMKGKLPDSELKRIRIIYQKGALELVQDSFSSLGIASDTTEFRKAQSIITTEESLLNIQEAA